MGSDTKNLRTKTILIVQNKGNTFMITASVINLGCKVNQYETDRVAEALAAAGVNIVFGLVPADVYVLNTCAVTNEGERKSRNMLTKLTRLNPNCKIYVCGCASQNNPSNFNTHPNVKCVIGTTKGGQNLAEIICNNLGLKFDPCSSGNFKGRHTRFVLKCQDGCNNFCSYCLIPYLRGREVSRPLSELKAEIDKMVKLGAKEIVLAGINLSSYGSDFKDGTSLLNVAKLFEGLPVRYRFSSLEVNIIDEPFIKYLSTQPNFCDHFHLSMQSGCDDTLKKMNRHYTAAEYLGKVKLIRKYFKNAGITTDVIVGFPTELEEHFEQTYKTCVKADFADMHVFAYSKRDGTVAAKFKNVATNVKERAAKLGQLANQQNTKFVTKNVGKVYPVIVEASKGEYLTGHTPNYIMCYFKGNYHTNDIINVKIIAPHPNGGAFALAVE